MEKVKLHLSFISSLLIIAQEVVEREWRTAYAVRFLCAAGLFCLGSATSQEDGYVRCRACCTDYCEQVHMKVWVRNEGFQDWDEEDLWRGAGTSRIYIPRNTPYVYASHMPMLLYFTIHTFPFRFLHTFFTHSSRIHTTTPISQSRKHANDHRTSCSSCASHSSYQGKALCTTACHPPQASSKGMWLTLPPPQSYLTLLDINHDTRRHAHAIKELATVKEVHSALIAGILGVEFHNSRQNFIIPQEFHYPGILALRERKWDVLQLMFKLMGWQM